MDEEMEDVAVDAEPAAAPEMKIVKNYKKELPPEERSYSTVRSLLECIQLV